MTSTTVRIEGVATTTRRLGELSRRVATRVVSKSVRAGGAPLVKAVRQGSPRDKGLLRKGTAQKVKTYRRSGTTMAIIGAKSRKDPATGRNPAKYLGLVEGGTKPHTIFGPLALPGGGVAQFVRHPGAKASHHVEAAGRQTAPTAVEAFSAKVAGEVTREVQLLQATP